MSLKDRAKGMIGERLRGERPGVLRAAAGAVAAGGLTTVVVYRLLRPSADED